jgi:uncharacterized protein YgbK (DUF1537 family)
MKVAIIADDLTGAMDVAGPFAARGQPTWVVVDDRTCMPEQYRDAAVVSINTASRHLPADQAARRVRDAAARLIPRGTDIVIKKIDSTLRGNVAAETLAMMDALGRPNAIVAPAFPGQGRTVRAGVVHVRGVPLAQTNFARDALSPPPLAPLHEVYRAASPALRAACVPPGGPFDLAARAGEQVAAVVDSESDQDLAQTVRALEGRLHTCVLVGSAGIAAAVAEGCLERGPRPEQPAVRDQVLVMVGSRAEQSIEQASLLAQQSGARMALAPNGRLADDGALAAQARTLVVRAAPGPEGQEGDAEAVAAEMARNAVRLLQARPIGALVATGGDTAVAILQALGQPALQVMGDLMPGIPYGRLRVAGQPVWLVTKAGGFGTREALCEIVDRLREKR